MGFTVAHEGGTSDAEFEAYARLLRQRGVDLGKVPRTPEPGPGRRWLYVWQTEAEAREFAEELKKRTGDRAWRVLPVEAPPSEGPLGPVEIRAGRRSDGWAFALHPLSRAMIQSVFPGADGASSIFVGVEPGDGSGQARAGLGQLAGQVAALLTGLKSEQLARLGYRVADSDTGQELVFVPPAETR
jgi:hypothetical protein